MSSTISSIKSLAIKAVSYLIKELKVESREASRKRYCKSIDTELEMLETNRAELAKKHYSYPRRLLEYFYANGRTRAELDLLGKIDHCEKD